MALRSHEGYCPKLGKKNRASRREESLHKVASASTDVTELLANLVAVVLWAFVDLAFWQANTDRFRASTHLD